MKKAPISFFLLLLISSMFSFLPSSNIFAANGLTLEEALKNARNKIVEKSKHEYTVMNQLTQMLPPKDWYGPEWDVGEPGDVFIDTTGTMPSQMDKAIAQHLVKDPNHRAIPYLIEIFKENSTADAFQHYIKIMSSLEQAAKQDNRIKEFSTYMIGADGCYGVVLKIEIGSTLLTCYKNNFIFAVGDIADISSGAQNDIKNIAHAIATGQKTQGTPQGLLQQQALSGIIMWGSEGSDNGQFGLTIDVSVDSQGNVYVVDYENNRIQKFTSDGKFITKWGSYGQGDGEFNKPNGITIDSTGNVYVVDYGNLRIQEFTSDGKFIRILKAFDVGGPDSSFRHVGMAISPSDYIYLSEPGSGQVKKFTKDGTLIKVWGGFGSEDGQFGGPGGISLDSTGNVYVTDNGNFRIQKFTSDGKFITKWGSYGQGDGEFNGVTDVDVDSKDNLYVVDNGNFRIQKFTSDGKFITKWGASGKNEGEFLWPLAAAVDSKGDVFVVDSYNHRVQKFTKEGFNKLTYGNPNEASIITNQSISIPSWIKNNAKWWHDGSIGDDDFIKGIQYMVQNGIISIPQTQQGSGSLQSIPSWIKNNAGWWADGQISDDDFLKGVQYLIENGLLNISQKVQSSEPEKTQTNVDLDSLDRLLPDDKWYFVIWDHHSVGNHMPYPLNANSGNIPKIGVSQYVWKEDSNGKTTLQIIIIRGDSEDKVKEDFQSTIKQAASNTPHGATVNEFSTTDIKADECHGYSQKNPYDLSGQIVICRKNNLFLSITVQEDLSTQIQNDAKSIMKEIISRMG